MADVNNVQAVLTSPPSNALPRSRSNRRPPHGHVGTPNGSRCVSPASTRRSSRASSGVPCSSRASSRKTLHRDASGLAIVLRRSSYHSHHSHHSHRSGSSKTSSRFTSAVCSRATSTVSRGQSTDSRCLSDRSLLTPRGGAAVGSASTATCSTLDGRVVPGVDLGGDFGPRGAIPELYSEGDDDDCTSPAVDECLNSEQKSSPLLSGDVKSKDGGTSSRAELHDGDLPVPLHHSPPPRAVAVPQSSTGSSTRRPMRHVAHINNTTHPTPHQAPPLSSPSPLGQRPTPGSSIATSRLAAPPLVSFPEADIGHRPGGGATSQYHSSSGSVLPAGFPQCILPQGLGVPSSADTADAVCARLEALHAEDPQQVLTYATAMVRQAFAAQVDVQTNSVRGLVAMVPVPSGVLAKSSSTSTLPNLSLNAASLRTSTRTQPPPLLKRDSSDSTAPKSPGEGGCGGRNDSSTGTAGGFTGTPATADTVAPTPNARSGRQRRVHRLLATLREPSHVASDSSRSSSPNDDDGDDGSSSVGAWRNQVLPPPFPPPSPSASGGGGRGRGGGSGGSSPSAHKVHRTSTAFLPVEAVLHLPHIVAPRAEEREGDSASARSRSLAEPVTYAAAASLTTGNSSSSSRQTSATREAAALSALFAATASPAPPNGARILAGVAEHPGALSVAGLASQLGPMRHAHDDDVSLFEPGQASSTTRSLAVFPGLHPQPPAEPMTPGASRSSRATDVASSMASVGDQAPAPPLHLPRPLVSMSQSLASSGALAQTGISGAFSDAADGRLLPVTPPLSWREQRCGDAGERSVIAPLLSREEEAPSQIPSPPRIAHAASAPFSRPRRRSSVGNGGSSAALGAETSAASVCGVATVAGSISESSASLLLLRATQLQSRKTIVADDAALTSNPQRSTDIPPVNSGSSTPQASVGTWDSDPRAVSASLPTPLHSDAPAVHLPCFGGDDITTVRTDGTDHTDGTPSEASISISRRAEVHPPDEMGATAVNEYVLIHEVGRGASGTVFLAASTTSDAVRAVKVVPRRHVKDSLVDGLLHEAAIMQRLQHRHIVRLFECIDDPSLDAVYLVMQYAPDRLAEIAPDGTCPPMAPTAVQRVALQAAAALRYMHRSGVIHGDIKPDNLLLDGDNILLADFGVSRVIEPVSESLSDLSRSPGTSFAPGDDTDRMPHPVASHIASRGAMSTMNVPADERRSGSASGLFKETDHSFYVPQKKRGTPLFLAPEVLNGGVPTAAADMWALGTTLYALLFGRLPFAPAPLLDYAHTVETEPVVVPVATDAAAEWAPVLQRLLAKEPEARMTAAELRRHPLLRNGSGGSQSKFSTAHT